MMSIELVRILKVVVLVCFEIISLHSPAKIKEYQRTFFHDITSNPTEIRTAFFPNTSL